jgi:hypothetical protein
MRSKLATHSDSNETSFESSLPEVQRQFNQLHGELKTSNVTVVEGFTKLNERFDTMENTRGELATGLVELGHRLGGLAATVATTRSPSSVMQGLGSPRALGGELDEEDHEDFKRASEHLISIRDIDCVDDIYYEFKGIGGLFEGKPIEGGMEACDARWKSRWRRHFSTADQRRFSRMAMLAKAIDKEVSDGVARKDVIARFDTYFRQKKWSFCALIGQLQLEGYIEKKAPRTKRIWVRGESPGEGGGGG